MTEELARKQISVLNGKIKTSQGIIAQHTAEIELCTAQLKALEPFVAVSVPAASEATEPKKK